VIPPPFPIGSLGIRRWAFGMETSFFDVSCFQADSFVGYGTNLDENLVFIDTE